MTLAKAIEILDQAASELGRSQDPDLYDAYQLGIEALKRQKMIEGKKSTTFTYPLPGETND